MLPLAPPWVDRVTKPGVPPDVPGVLVGVGGGFAGTDGLGSGSMGALASGVNLGSPTPARESGERALR